MADLIRGMAAAGAPAEAIALAVEAVEGAQAAVEAKRAVERDRKRRQRERDKGGTVTGQSRDMAGTVTPNNDSTPSLDKKPPDPEKLIPTPCVRDARARDGYHRLPEDWRPMRPLPPRIQAKADQWPPGALDDELAAFHRWAANASNEKGKGRKLDWDKAWANWIERRHDERYGRHRQPLGRDQSSDGLSSTARAALRVFGAGGGPGVPQ